MWSYSLKNKRKQWMKNSELCQTWSRLSVLNILGDNKHEVIVVTLSDSASIWSSLIGTYATLVYVNMCLTHVALGICTMGICLCRAWLLTYQILTHLNITSIIMVVHMSIKGFHFASQVYCRFVIINTLEVVSGQEFTLDKACTHTWHVVPWQTSTTCQVESHTPLFLLLQ